jgi:hypothetical protein
MSAAQAVEQQWHDIPCFGGCDAMSKLCSIIFGAGVAICCAPPAAHAITTTDETFVFTGTCTTDCTGTATGILTLTNYTQVDFVSFDYISSDDNYDYIKNSSTVVTGIIPVDLPADANVTIQGATGISFCRRGRQWVI